MQNSLDKPRSVDERMNEIRRDRDRLRSLSEKRAALGLTPFPTVEEVEKKAQHES